MKEPPHRPLQELVWDVHDLQSRLIELGDESLRRTSSFRAWIRSHLFGRRLPFRELKERSDDLVADFQALGTRLAEFQEAQGLSELEGECLRRLRRFHSALSDSAMVLAENQSVALEGAEGVRHVPMSELVSGSKRFNASIEVYYAAANELQPVIRSLFEEE